MRRIIVIGALFLVMYALPYLQVEVESSFNPKSLATLGFILLAAYTLGELTNSFGFPKITGYILTGVFFGPYVINLFSLGVVEDLTLIDGLAIGLIALTAGGEMKLEGLRRVASSLGWILAIKGFLILTAVTAAVYVARPLVPFLHQAGTPLVLAVGAIFGILALGTSPAVTVAVINETQSRGRLADLTLGIAVVKDIVMVVLLAMAIALARLYSAPGAVFEPSVLGRISGELGLSILAGAIVGLLAILYIRFVHAEMWLFIIGLVLMATAAANFLHLEALLVLIAAGFVVQNFSQYGEALIHPIENVSLPVYVVFFSIAGAGLDLLALRQVWAIATILVLVRLAAIYTGTRVALSLTSEAVEMRDNAWMAFIAQAGVVLGLSIIIEQNLPLSVAAGTGPLGEEIQTVVLATIALNLALGPITFKFALSRVGETLRARQRAEEAASRSRASFVEDARPPVESPTHVELRLPNFQSEQLNSVVGRMRDDLLTLLRDFQESFLDVQTSGLRRLVAGIKDRYRSSIEEFESQDRRDIPPAAEDLIRRLRQNRTGFSRWLLQEISGVVASHQRSEAGRTAFEELFRVLDGICDGARVYIEVEQEPHCFSSVPGDTLRVRWIRWLKRVWNRLQAAVTGRPMRRIIPFRKLARYHLAGSTAPRLLRVAGLAASQTYFFLRRLQNVYSQIDRDYDAVISRLEKSAGLLPEDPSLQAATSAMLREIEEDLTEADRDLERYCEDMRLRAVSAITQSYCGLLNDLRIAGTFELPERRFRFSRIYKECLKAKMRAARAFELWRQYEVGLSGAHARHIEVVLLVDTVSLIVDETVSRVLSRLDESLMAGVRAAKTRFEESIEPLRGSLVAQRPVGQVCDEITRHQHLLGLTVNETLSEMNRLRETRELTALIDVMLQRFAELSDHVPREYVMLDQKDLALSVIGDHAPPEAKLVRVPFRSAARSFLETEIARNLADANRIMFSQIDEAIRSITEVQQFISFNLKTAVEQLQGGADETHETRELTHARELVLGTLQRAVNRLPGTLEKIRELEVLVHDQIIVNVDDRMRDLETLILQKSARDLRLHLAQKKAMQQGLDIFQGIGRHVRTRIRALLRRYRPWGRGVAQDFRTAFGLSQYTRSEALALYDQAKLDDAAFSRLPYIYQRLFDIEPLENADFLVAREEELSAVGAAKARWQQGLTCAVAVVGELGSGKTSFINGALSAVLADARAYTHAFVREPVDEARLAQVVAGLFGMGRVSSFEDIEDKLNEMPEKPVVVLEDAHHLFLRTLGGFDAIKRLLLLIAKTSRRVLWILSMREHSWRYLDHVLGISDYFAFVISMELVSRSEVEQVILTRHRVSGFDLRFLPDAAMRERKTYRNAPSDEARQEILRREFFDRLNRASEGNILASIFYWLRSIGEVQENALTVRPLRPLDFGPLREFEIDKLLTLGMVIQHGSLSPREHSIIFGTGLEASLAVLTHLANVNLMEKETTYDGEPRFSINRLVYKELSKELCNRNILH